MELSDDMRLAISRTIDRSLGLPYWHCMTTMYATGREGSRFLELPDEIHLEIARIIDPRLCSSPSSQHARDPEYSIRVYWQSRPDRTLARLARVCKRLQCIYAPYSTWRSVYIEATNRQLARKLGESYHASPSLTRVLKYPETGVYARELLIQYKSSKLEEEGLPDVNEGFTMARGNLANLDRFLAKTPQLETVRCISSDDDADHGVRLPIEFFVSLSKLASLRYLYLGEFDMKFKVSPSFPHLPQVRILRYSPSDGEIVLGDLFRFSMPNIHTLYVTAHRLDYTSFEDVDSIVDAIQVRCASTSPLLGTFLRLPFISLTSFFDGFFTGSQTRAH
jgi:hypothetical protein